MGYRFLKKYNLNYHLTPGSSIVVPGHTATMSSYAGTIFSLDDFLTLSSGLVTTETSLFIYNSSLYTHLAADGQLMEPARVMVSKHNSGTYNNQWMVIDYNKLEEAEGGEV